MFVVDCSVTTAWCFEGQANTYADRVMERLTREPALAPSIRPLELANALVMGERRKLVSATEVSRFLQLVAELPITIDEGTAQRALGPILGLARDHNLSAYEAAYLELAIREGLPLATRDEGMKRAARSLGVSLI